MAQTRNQVLSLFGASPEQIMQQERQRQAKMLQSIRNPYQQMGTAIGIGLGRLFGGESADVTRQRELYSQLQGVNFESPEQLRAAAATLASQFPDRALQLLSMADQRETSAQQRATSEAQAEAARATKDLRSAQTEEIENFEKVQTIVPATSTDPLTGATKTVYSIKEITVPANKAQEYRNLFDQRYKALTGSEPSTSGSTALPEGAVKFDTGTGTKVALLPTGKYVTVTDEGNIGVILDDQGIAALGGLVDPVKVKKKAPVMPVEQERQTRLRNQTIAPKPMPGTSVEDQTNPFAL